jgi:hypothetical protein
MLEASDAAMLRQVGAVAATTVGRVSGNTRTRVTPFATLDPWTTTERADGGYAIGRRDIPEAITRSDDVRVLGVGEVDGVGAWVIWYTFRFLMLEGVTNVWRTEWIDVDSLRLLRQFEQRRRRLQLRRLDRPPI